MSYSSPTFASRFNFLPHHTLYLYICRFDPSVADPGFQVGGGANPPGQHTILPDFPQNCMKLKKIWNVGGAPVDSPLLLSSNFLISAWQLSSLKVAYPHFVILVLKRVYFTPLFLLKILIMVVLQSLLSSLISAIVVLTTPIFSIYGTNTHCICNTYSIRSSTDWSLSIFQQSNHSLFIRIIIFFNILPLAVSPSVAFSYVVKLSKKCLMPYYLVNFLYSLDFNLDLHILYVSTSVPLCLTLKRYFYIFMWLALSCTI